MGKKKGKEEDAEGKKGWDRLFKKEDDQCHSPPEVRPLGRLRTVAWTWAVFSGSPCQPSHVH